MPTLTDNKIYLASKSPRRRELLDQIGVQYELLWLRDASGRAADVPEIVAPNESPLDYVTRVTLIKAHAAWQHMIERHFPPRPILAADTAVALEGVIYGKPANRDEAIAMLSHLSGRTHQVYTSVAVLFESFQRQITQVSDVTFCALTPNDIARHCDSSEPYDKAGGYAVQGRAAQFISQIKGSYSGIMGLPLFETTQLLSEVGIHLP
jgi:septum formation protein